jgi:hypothetical protein
MPASPYHRDRDLGLTAFCFLRQATKPIRLDR